MVRHLLVASTLLLAACATTPRHREALGALGPYSASVEARGLVFVSGQIGPMTAFIDEVDAALDKVEAELARSGLGLADVVSVTVYLTDLELYAAFNRAYAARVPAPYPARACVAVTALPGGARCEIQAIAARR